MPCRFTDYLRPALLPLALAALYACAPIPVAVRSIEPSTTPYIELQNTPFFPQERYQCGPAALATVLRASGANTRPEDLIDKVYLPERRGSLQLEMLAAARDAERIPYRVDGTMAALGRELDSGRPVLVLQNLGTSWLPRWHYAVVIGIDREKQQVMLRSGLEKRRLTGLDLFLRTWRRSDYWGFVTLEPGELPATLEADRYFSAVADMESTGHTSAAAAGWGAALEQWPDNPVALFGLANTSLRLGKASTAEELYRRVIDMDSENVLARNNLAYAMADQGRVDEALELLEHSLQQAGGDTAEISILQDSIDDLRQPQTE